MKCDHAAGLRCCNAVQRCENVTYSCMQIQPHFLVIVCPKTALKTANFIF